MICVQQTTQGTGVEKYAIFLAYSQNAMSTRFTILVREDGDGRMRACRNSSSWKRETWNAEESKHGPFLSDGTFEN